MISQEIDRSAEAIAKRANEASKELRLKSDYERNCAIISIARHLVENIDTILERNKNDICLLPDSTHANVNRLILDDNKIETISNRMISVTKLDEITKKVDYAMHLKAKLKVYRQAMPIGTIMSIFESRPDVGLQISALALKSGNSVILKGGKEASITNKFIERLIRETLIENGFNPFCIQYVYDKEITNELLKMDHYIGVVIPRGGLNLVKHVKETATMRVYASGEGICSIYVHKSADFNKMNNTILDAKLDYVAACNSLEQLLIDNSIPDNIVMELIKFLMESNIDLLAVDPKLISLGCNSGTDSDLIKEFLSPRMGIRYVENIDEAISIINANFSKHTDVILSNDQHAVDHFFNNVESACVFANASTRFSDGYRFGFGAEVGICTDKLSPRGPIALEGLVTYKYHLIGDYDPVNCQAGETYQYEHISLDEKTKSTLNHIYT